MGLVVLVVAAPGAAQGPSPTTLALSAETYRDAVPVSGGVVRGVMADGADGQVDPGELHVRLTPRGSTRVCFEISSQDGRYHAFASHPIEPATETLRFSLATAHADVLRGYDARQVAVLAQLKSGTCDARTRVDAYAVASWGQPSGQQTLRVFVNSGGLSDTRVRVPVGEKMQNTRCEAAPDGARVAFDTICSLGAEPGAQYAKTRILRRDFDSPAPPVRLPLSGWPLQ